MQHPEDIKNISIIIPSLNPDEKLCKTINSLIDAGFDDIVCVNDGSKEECLQFFPKENEKITLLKHDVNKGKGAALKTAFSYIMENRPNSIGAVTVDGDGQHTAKDVLFCAGEMADKIDSVILGCRDFSNPDVPTRSKFGNKTTSLVFKLLCGMKISDTQTGLRAIPAKYFPLMLKISGDRFEYETNMLLELNIRKIPILQPKIETVYIEENKTSHFRPVKDSFKIYSLILKFSLGQFFKFLFGSALSFIIDGLIVYLLLSLAEKYFSIDFNVKTLSAMLATFCARVIARAFSSAVNYTFNRKLVFPSDMPLKTSLFRYYCLAIPILIISSVLTALFENLSVFNTAFLIMLLGYAIDIVLFIINYFLQKRWVFKK